MTSSVRDIQNEPGISSQLLKNWHFDSLFIFAITALALVSGYIVVLNPNLFFPILLLDLWILGYHHVVSTYTRLCFEKSSVREFRFFLFVLPVLVALAVFAIAKTAGVWVIATIYLYWQWFHYTRQSWGVQQTYRRKAGESRVNDQWLVKPVFYLIPLWGILHRSAQNPDSFLGMEIWVFPVPVMLANIVGVIAVAALGLWIVFRFYSWYRGAPQLIHTAYMVSHFVVFYVGYLFIEDITFGWLVINIWHNAQYILFVWLYNNKKFQHGTGKQSLLGFLSKTENWIYYFGFCLLVTTIMYASIDRVVSDLELSAVPLAIIVYQSINFHHYIVDSFIWKLRKPKLQRELGIAK